MPESTSFVAVEDLDAAETLAAAEAAVRDRRAVEVRELELALHWADLHADDPRHDGQPPRRVRPGWSGSVAPGPRWCRTCRCVSSRSRAGSTP
jgi:hypothetical protein